MQKIFLPFFIFFAGLLFTTGYSLASPEKEPVPEEIVKVRKIAVLPIISQIEGKTKPEHQEGIDILTKVVADFFKDHKSVVIVSEAQKEALAADFVGDRAALARNIGAKLNCDALLTIALTRYRPREGGDYSSNTPASVSFEFKLIGLKDGSILCSGLFAETQQSLFENILGFSKSVRRGFKWITAEELAREGVVEKFSNCSYLTVKDQ